jgi:hypothetical protein
MLNALMTTFHPRLCVLGRTGTNPGVEQIAETLVINPGHLSEGSAAWFDWDRAPGEQVKFLDLQSMARPVRPPNHENSEGLHRQVERTNTALAYAGTENRTQDSEAATLWTGR